MLLVLFASSQFMVGMHFCQGDVQGISLFKEAPACEHNAQLPPCHAKAMEGCCDDEVIIHESAGFMMSNSDINIEIPFTTLTIVYPLLLNLIDEQFTSSIKSIDDHPPNGIKPDILILIQSFLI